VTVSFKATPAADTKAGDAPPSETAPQVHESPEQTDEQPEAISITVKASRARKTKRAVDDGKEKRLSAQDAAAKVLGETGQPMTCQEMIAAMAAKDYWTSPGGKTPQATLYSAMLREITTKGTNSRFRKADRGKFALADSAV
jgi:hypothetical protein